MNEKTYCSKSWTDINIDFETRTLKHCCKAKTYNFPDQLTEDFISNSDLIQNRRLQSLQNVAHNDCISCWNDYDKGNSAYRDWANRWDDNYIKNHQQLLSTDNQISYVEIKTDRTCDMSCIYCSSWSSSKIAQEEGTSYQDLTIEKDYDIFKSWIVNYIARPNTSNQIVFIFLGGEPTASERFYELIDFIEDAAQNTTKKIRLEICTNANSKKFLMEKIIQRMNTSKLAWGIGISNESFGETAELIRHGLSWERFQNNFKQYIQHVKTELIVLSPTANIFSLKSFHQYIDWVHDQFRQYAPNKEFTWYGNFISWPDEMDIAHLPTSYNQYIDLAEQAISRTTDLNYVYKENFTDYLNQMRQRIGTAYNLDYKNSAEKFLTEKQKIKKTDQLIKLMSNLDL
jgi:organic radical activating enzyme